MPVGVKTMPKPTIQNFASDSTGSETALAACCGLLLRLRLSWLLRLDRLRRLVGEPQFAQPRHVLADFDGATLVFRKCLGTVFGGKALTLASCLRGDADQPCCCHAIYMGMLCKNASRACFRPVAGRANPTAGVNRRCGKQANARQIPIYFVAFWSGQDKSGERRSARFDAEFSVRSKRNADARIAGPYLVDAANSGVFTAEADRHAEPVGEADAGRHATAPAVADPNDRRARRQRVVA